MLSVTPDTFVTLRQSNRDSQPRAAFLVDLVSATAGVNVADAARVLAALSWLDRTGRVSGMSEGQTARDTSMEQRLELSRWAMVELLRAAPADGQTEEIRMRLSRLYARHGNDAEASAIAARC